MVPRVLTVALALASLECGGSVPTGINGEGNAVAKNKLNVANGRYISRNQSIVVIGAGPAGLHITRELQKRGFRDITILEATDRVGGKSFTRYMNSSDQKCEQRKIENGRVVFDKDCVAIEYGTCFFHSGYHRVRELLHEYHDLDTGVPLRREAYTGIVISKGSGFDFVYQMDAEWEWVIKQFVQNGETISNGMMDQVRQHITMLKSWGLTATDMFNGTNDAAEEMIQTTIAVMMNAEDGNKEALANNFSAVGHDLMIMMKKKPYQTWLGGMDYMQSTANMEIDGQQMRGVDLLDGWDNWVLALASVFTDTITAYLAQTIFRYCDLRKQIFGEPKFRMPSRLSPDTLQDLSIPFKDWLTKHGMQGLIPFLQVSHAAQGYGYLWEIPAFYGLLWISPDLMLGVFSNGLNLAPAYKTALMRALGVDATRFAQVRGVITMLPEGYSAIWREMHKHMKADNGNIDMVQYNVTNLRIDRRLNDPSLPVTVSWNGQDGEDREGNFDFLIYTPALKYFGTYVTDVQSEESEIFNVLKGETFAMTVYRVNVTKYPIDGYTNQEVTGPLKWKPPPRTSLAKAYNHAVTMYNADNIVDGPRSNYKWFVDRNDPRQWALPDEIEQHFSVSERRIAGQFASKEVSEDVAGTTGDRKVWWGDGSFGSGGMQGENADRLKAALINRLKDDMKARGIDDIEVLEQVPWPYFWHFGGQDIKEGLPWDLLELQGRHKTWYLGASSSFESVNDIVNYNLMMLDKSFFEAHKIRSNSDFAVNDKQDLDGMYDKKAMCCCTSHKIAGCALIPLAWQTMKRDFWGIRHWSCPNVRKDHWPMTPSQESDLHARQPFGTATINGQSEQTTSLTEVEDGCDNLRDVHILPVSVYTSRVGDCDLSSPGCQWRGDCWNSTSDCLTCIHCESGIDEDCGQRLSPASDGCYDAALHAHLSGTSIPPHGFKIGFIALTTVWARLFA